jgi:hypothetical protein
MDEKRTIDLPFSPEDVAAGRVHEAVDLDVEQLRQAIDAATASCMTAVQTADVDKVFDAGMQMGVTVGIGLAMAHAIKDRMQREERRTAGQHEFAKRHDHRAEAFGQLAAELTQWNIRHA